MRIWVSKRALVYGIQTYDGRVAENGRAYTGLQPKNSSDSVLFRGEWHETEQAARDKAEEMRKKKILWHKNQIRKLEKLEF